MKSLDHWILVQLCLGAFVLLTGCGHQTEPKTMPSLPMASVQVQSVEQETRLATEEVVGTVQAKHRAVVAAKASGTVEKMDAVPGRSVAAGDLLVQINAREIQAKLDQALAVREQAKGDMERYTRLLADRAVTQQEYDAVQARQRVAEAAVLEAEAMLGYTQVKAPFAGLITRKYVDQGDLATPGRPLFEIEDPTRLQVQADVPEGLITKIKLGDPVRVTIPTLDRDLTGQVSEISPAADPASRTFLVKVDLPAAAELRSGQFGRVAIPVTEVATVRVPLSAVVVRGQMEMVFVVSNRIAHLRLVKTGKRGSDRIDLVSGLAPGETIVTDGAVVLRDGQPVEVKP